MAQQQLMNACRKLADYAGMEVYRARVMVWGAEQLLLENSDNTISETELRARVGAILEVVERHLTAFGDLLEQSHSAFGEPAASERIQQLLIQASERP